VCKLGEILNIPDAYSDARFNQDVDRKTGYTTNTILCVPLKDKDGSTVIGAIQLVNKAVSKHARCFVAPLFVCVLPTYFPLLNEEASKSRQEAFRGGSIHAAKLSPPSVMLSDMCVLFFRVFCAVHYYR
jgi:hypothetical protein